MTGRLFLHIGPPKTATTSLQMALQDLEHPSYSYAGVFQPRHRNNKSLAQRLNRAARGANSLVASDIAGLHAWLNAGRLVMVSEEMLSLKQPGVTIAAKIKRLGEVLAGLPVTVFVTLRCPEEGLPSLYQQIHRDLPLALRLNFGRFCASSWAECYSYGQVANHLAAFGFRDVRWLEFKRISEGRLTTADLFGEFDLWEGRPLRLRRVNVGMKSVDGSERHLPPVTLSDLAHSGFVQHAIDTLGLRGRWITRIDSAFLDRIVLRGRCRPLSIPRETAAKLRDEYEAVLASLHNNQNARRDPV